MHLCLLFPASLPPGLAPSHPAKLRARRGFGTAAEHSRLLCPAPRSLPPGGLGTAGLPTGGSFDQPSPTHCRVAGGEMFAGLRAAMQPVKPAEQTNIPTLPRRTRFSSQT